MPPKILSVIFLNLLALNLTASVVNVCPTCPISTISEGVKKAGYCDSLLIGPGKYLESRIIVDKPMHIIGMNYPVIDAEEKGEIILVTANQVSIEGLELRNVGTSYMEDRAAIRLGRVKEFIVRKNKLLNTFFGIYLEHSSNGLVEENIILGEAEQEMSSGNAIHAWYCEGLQVLNNYVEQHRDGIYFEFVNKSLVQGNISNRNVRYGLHFMFSNDDTYTDNIFSENGAGVAVMFSKNIDMFRNQFNQNWGQAAFGLLLKEIYDAEIIDNDFYKNTTGIYVEGSTRINYQKNNFRQNGWAINMAGGCLDNVFHQNNFLSNTLDLVVNSKVNNNTFNGNFWSEYAGYDLDRDGLGDVPHRPVKLFSYILSKSPEAIILLRSLFVDLVNISEKISPVFTPANILDEKPFMKPLL